MGCAVVWYGTVQYSVVYRTILQHIPYGRDRVFNNYSGNRPAEPSSVAVAATWHTLTRMLLQLVYIVRASCPGGRLLQSWELVNKKENEKGVAKSKEEKDVEDKSFSNNSSNHVDTKTLR